jgi:hypothetical protein
LVTGQKRRLKWQKSGYKSMKRGVIVELNVNKEPTNEQIRLIFKDTYNFYLNWKDIDNEEDWNILTDESREIEKRYPFDLCLKILIGILNIIEKDYMRRNRDG